MEDKGSEMTGESLGLVDVGVVGSERETIKNSQRAAGRD